ncbi:hypothetical protein [Corallococcus interemptor]|uniref:hypothetical protein n=1 Tax=Corallococcus interemptor TaxID=2316720 RepID=UPI0011C3CA10|nr:hypothetical protein [Corallococcus interemptor]
MGPAGKTLTALHTLLKEEKFEDAIKLCAKAFGSTEAQVLELAKLTTVDGLFEIARIIAMVLDSDDDARPMNALGLALICETPAALAPGATGPRVLKLAKQLARLPS